MYSKEHASTYWQKAKAEGRTKQIAERNKNNVKKYYDNNKEAISLKKRETMVNNYLKYALIRIKSRCKKENVEFNITEEDLVLPTHCPIFGMELEAAVGRGAKDNSYSLDRVNPQGGYVKGNVVIVSNKANRMKNNGSLDDLKKLVEYYERL
jgi:hypothetical protein